MLKDMLQYVLPYARKLLPSSLKKNINTKWLQQRSYVASHVRSAFEKVKVYVVSDEELCSDLVAQQMYRLNNPVHFVGLDCEWDSRKKEGVALLQVSSGTDCILYRTCKSDGSVPINLKKLLEDRKILKFGVGIEEDVRRLRLHGVQVKGFVDLRNLAHRCVPVSEQGYTSPDEEIYQWNSLSALSLNTLDIQLSKNYTVRCGNWEASSLSRKQILYAAKDAIVSLEIFYALVLLRKVRRQQNYDVLEGAFKSEIDLHKIMNTLHQDPSSICFYYSHMKDSLNDLDDILPTESMRTVPSKTLIDLGYSLCQGIVDLKHKPKLIMDRSTNRKTATRAFSTKASTEKVSKMYKHQCREKPLYENCFLIGPDKQVLATVNRNKAEWYLHKNLGVIEKESPFTVQLLFEPSGRPMPDADYYTTVKDNVCVVCGSTESFVKKNIIPHDYRKYFPLELKDHMSHDVLLMCLLCHRTAQVYDEELRQELANKYHAPFGTKAHMYKVDNPHLGKVRSAAKALLKNADRIPDERRALLEKIVTDYFQVSDAGKDLLKTAMEMDIREENKKFQGLHGERVVKALIEEHGLVDFIRLWRSRFLELMKPKYLPPLWSIEHNLHKVST